MTPTVRRGDLLVMVAAALLVMVIIALVSEPVRVLMDGFWLTLRDLWFSVTDTF